MALINEIGVREAAQIVGVHENTIRNWVRSGVLEAGRRTSSGHMRFSRKQIEALKILLPEPPPEDRTEAYKRGFQRGWKDAMRLVQNITVTPPFMEKW